MTRGIVLIAVGGSAYGKFAFNMALTLKSYSNIPIQLICEEQTIAGLSATHKAFFDIITPIEKEDAYSPAVLRREEVLKLSPGKLKLSIYKYLAFDENIYLDIDGICIRDLEPLFEECAPYYFRAQVVGQANINDKEFPSMQWAKLEDIKAHYDLPDNAIIPALNSSFMYIKKSPEAEQLFSQALENFNNPVKSNKWGGTLPDELFMNIALAQVGLMPRLEKTPYPVYFRIRRDIGEAVPLKEIQSNHFVIGVFGDRHFNHSSLVATGNSTSGGYYDRIVTNCSRELIGKKQQFKIGTLMREKHVLKK